MIDEQKMQAGIVALGIQHNDEQIKLCKKYIALLQKWNTAYNLTAIKHPDEQVIRHVLDSLSISDLIEGDVVLDVGSGAGLPGIPLAIFLTKKNFTLLDSNGKKVRFMIQAKNELGLKNINPAQQRADRFVAPVFDTIVSRALGSIEDFLAATRHLAHNKTRWLAMKGSVLDKELAAIPNGYTADIRKLTVPYLDEARHVIIIRLNHVE